MMPLSEHTARFLATCSFEDLAGLERMDRQCVNCRWWDPLMLIVSPGDSPCIIDLSGVPVHTDDHDLQGALTYSAFFDDGEGDCPIPDMDVPGILEIARLEKEARK